MTIRNFYMPPKRTDYDAIVVGSGITGGFAAKELCEKGLKTLVLERGHLLSTDHLMLGSTRPHGSIRIAAAVTDSGTKRTTRFRVHATPLARLRSSSL